MKQNTITAFQRLSDILDTLRRECPWDKVQTLKSLRYLTVEEVYELSEAILNLDSQDSPTEQAVADFKKELGDIFMHLMFYAKIAEDMHLFSLADVLDAICDKLVQRHPKIYPKTDSGEHAAESWEQLKMHEGRKSVLEGVPATLPPLVKAVRIQEKVSGMGFDFDSAQGAHNKVREEYAEFCETPTEEEFGDLLFALVKWGQMCGINADDALSYANIKFQRRFQHVEASVLQMGDSISSMSKDDLLSLWQEAKALEHKQ